MIYDIRSEIYDYFVRVAPHERLRKNDLSREYMYLNYRLFS